MEINVYVGDLKPECRDFRDAYAVSFEMFQEDVQTAILCAGYAIFRFGGSVTMRILPPSPESPADKQIDELAESLADDCEKRGAEAAATLFEYLTRDIQPLDPEDDMEAYRP